MTDKTIDELRREISDLIEDIRYEWYPFNFEKTDSRAIVLLRKLYLLHNYLYSSDSLKVEAEFDEIFSQVAMYMSGWEGDIIEQPLTILNVAG